MESENWNIKAYPNDQLLENIAAFFGSKIKIANFNQTWRTHKKKKKTKKTKEVWIQKWYILEVGADDAPKRFDFKGLF